MSLESDLAALTLRVAALEAAVFPPTPPTPPTPPAGFSLLSRWTADASDPMADAQGVATDGTFIWYATSSKLRKLQKNGTEMAERSVTSDPPTDKAQINGLCYKNGVLYVSAAKVVGAVRTSYIVEYDPTTLDYLLHRVLPGDRFSEGLTWHENSWWVCFHAHKKIARYDVDWSFVDEYDVTFPLTGVGAPYGPEQGYDGLFWDGDYLCLNIHEIYGQNYVDVYRWTGTGFEETARRARPTPNASQGMARDPVETDVVWFVERNYTGASGVAKCAIGR